MEDEEVTGEEIKSLLKVLRKNKNKYLTTIIVVCLFILFYELGYVNGYRESFAGQEDFYEEKMLRYCICKDEPIYTVDKIIEQITKVEDINKLKIIK